MARRLFETKPLPEPMSPYRHLGLHEKALVKDELKKCHSKDAFKMSFAIWRPFCAGFNVSMPASVCQTKFCTVVVICAAADDFLFS